LRHGAILFSDIVTYVKGYYATMIERVKYYYEINYISVILKN
jgi:hypothetical protein